MVVVYVGSGVIKIGVPRIAGAGIRRSLMADIDGDVFIVEASEASVAAEVITQYVR